MLSDMINEDFNKDGKVYKYFSLDEILSLDIPDKLKDEYKQKFGKLVYYDGNGYCRLGFLTGLEKNEQLSGIYFIIENDGKTDYIPVWKSITRPWFDIQIIS